MAYQDFRKKVQALVHKAGFKAVFTCEDGRFFAYCSDGVVIIGNPLSTSVLVRWGSGHQAIAHI